MPSLKLQADLSKLQTICAEVQLQVVVRAEEEAKVSRLFDPLTFLFRGC